MPARSAKRASSLSILRQLGIVGWDRIEPVVFAAVAAELPLLLVGPHGSAKTMLLARLAACLGLAHRQYNASLLNFDDLVGFPVPDGGKIVYLQTPATIWEAESVFFDEVSRCRPDLQNKLFPIVHDRVVQGVPLERLRHRWAAMNPPPPADGGTAAHEYAGTEPLDVALADRFAFIVNVPSFADLSRQDQLAVLAGAHRSHVGAEERIREAVQSVREVLAADTGEWRPAAAEYVHIAAAKLTEAGHPLSTRRAVQVTTNIGAVRAALAVIDGGHALGDVFYSALCVSLPDAAWGNPVPASTVLTVHRAAWETARLEAGNPLKAIHAETSPVRRIALALGPGIADLQAGQVVADSYAMLPDPARLATAPVLMPRLARRPGLPLSAVEAVARDYARVALDGEATVMVSRGGHDWKRDIVSGELPKVDRRSFRGRVLSNVALALVADDQPFRFADVERAYDEAKAALCGRPGAGDGDED